MSGFLYRWCSAQVGFITGGVLSGGVLPKCFFIQVVFCQVGFCPSGVLIQVVFCQVHFLSEWVCPSLRIKCVFCSLCFELYSVFVCHLLLSKHNKDIALKLETTKNDYPKDKYKDL